jgi:hypothetical protein
MVAGIAYGRRHKKEFGQTFFKVSGFPKYLMRHEILRI